jgi:hypothetical protein
MPQAFQTSDEYTLATPIPGGAWTVFCVGKRFSSGSDFALMSQPTSPINMCAPMVIGGGTQGFVATQAGYFTAPIPSIAFHLITVTSTPDVYFDGVVQSVAFGGGSFSALDFTRIGRRSGSEYLAGWISEILVYNSVLSTVDRQKVETYLRGKWATP